MKKAQDKINAAIASCERARDGCIIGNRRNAQKHAHKAMHDLSDALYELKQYGVKKGKLLRAVLAK